ncbi:unnamed protein product [Rhizoctonia solani]|uniref:Uncharacterized protein n=1 Tax=Rhizoctonia solani TaxID=456999 RepID=A0A8H3BAW4_9AGAM|nr:unnamed protein product [Rhizoctonia solani]
MGVKNHTLVRCAATVPPDRNLWFNTLFWVISLFQLLTSVGREIISHLQRLIRRICRSQAVGPRSSRRESPSVIPHRVPVVTSEPTNRGPGANINSSAIEASSSTDSLDHEQPAFRTRSGRVTTRDAAPSQPNSNVGRPYVDPRPVARILFYGAENKGDVFIKDMRKLAKACNRYLGNLAQVQDRVVMGDIGFEFGMFLNQTNVRVQDMFIFGVSGHGRIWNNLVTFCLSENKSISFRVATSLSISTVSLVIMFLDVCLATMAAEQHGLYKIWPSDELLSSFNLRDGASRPRVGPKIVLWAASGRQGVAYFRPGKNSYMLAATCKTLEEHVSNVTRREMYKKIMEHLERRLNKKLRRKDTAPQIPAILSSVSDRDRVLDGYVLQPLLLGDEQNTV